MNILLLNLLGTLVVIVIREPGQLSRRAAALRDWCSERNY